MEYMEELKEMLCDELEKIAKKGELTAGSLETIDKLAHSIKSLATIMAMDDYSEEDGSYDDGGSYARGRTGNVRRDSMGRYSKRRGSYARGGQNGNRGRSNNGYSGHGDFIEELQEMMEDANEQERMAIRKVLKMMEE